MSGALDFVLLYKGQKADDGNTSIDTNSKTFCEELLNRTVEFNRNRPVDKVKYAVQPSTEEIRKAFLTVLVSSDSGGVVTEDAAIKSSIPSIIERPSKGREKCLLRVILGEYQPENFPKELHYFPYIQFKTDRLKLKLEAAAILSAILFALWRKYTCLENICANNGVANNCEVENAIKPDRNVSKMEKFIEEVLEEDAFQKFCTTYKFPGTLVADLRRIGKVTKCGLLSLNPLLELYPKYLKYGEETQNCLELALNELHCVSGYKKYEWRELLDASVYKFGKTCTAAVMVKFKTSISDKVVERLVEEKDKIEYALHFAWKLRGDALIRLWDIRGDLEFWCIIEAKSNNTMNFIFENIENFMNRSPDEPPMMITSRNEVSIGIKPALSTQESTNFSLKRISLDRNFLEYIDFYSGPLENGSYRTDEEAEVEDEDYGIREEEEREFEEDVEDEFDRTRLGEKVEELILEELITSELDREVEKRLFSTYTTISEESHKPNVFRISSVIREDEQCLMDSYGKYNASTSCTFDLTELDSLQNGECVNGPENFSASDDPDTIWKVRLYPDGSEEEYKDWMSVGLLCSQLSDRNPRRIMLEFLLTSGTNVVHNNMDIFRFEEAEIRITRYLKRKNGENMVPITCEINYGYVPQRVDDQGLFIFNTITKQRFTRLSAFWTIENWKSLHFAYNSSFYSPIFGKGGFVFALKFYPNGERQRKDGTITAMLKMMDAPSKSERNSTLVSFSLLCAGQEESAQEIEFYKGKSLGKEFGHRDEFKDPTMRIQVNLQYPC